VAVLPKSAKLAESQVSDNFQLLVSESGLTETFARKSYHWQRRCVSWPATVPARSARAFPGATLFERLTFAFRALLLAPRRAVAEAGYPVVRHAELSLRNV
jgi:hypothetical protein